MKYFIIVDIGGNYKGYTTSEEILKEFFNQRNKKDYIVKTFNKKKLHPDFIKSLENSWSEITINEGTLIFSDEEEYFIESLNQYFIDTRCSIERLCKVIEFFNFSKHEQKILKNCLAIINNKNNCASNYYDEFDDVIEYDNYIKIDKMVKEIIKKF